MGPKQPENGRSGVPKFSSWEKGHAEKISAQLRRVDRTCLAANWNTAWGRSSSPSHCKQCLSYAVMLKQGVEQNPMGLLLRNLAEASQVSARSYVDTDTSLMHSALSKISRASLDGMRYRPQTPPLLEKRTVTKSIT